MTTSTIRRRAASPRQQAADYTPYQNAINLHAEAVIAEEQAANAEAQALAALEVAQANYAASQEALAEAKASTDAALNTVNSEHDALRP